MTDEQIIADIQKGASSLNAAVRWIYQKSDWKGQIKSRLKKKGASDHESDDVFQEAVCALVFNIRDGKFRGESKLTTYLSSIATNKWLTARQKSQRAISAGGHILANTEDHPTRSAEDELLSNEQKQHLDRILNTIGEKCKKVLSLWALHYPMSEIAEKMQYKSAGMARKKKHQCFKRLQEKITIDPYFNK